MNEHAFVTLKRNKELTRFIEAEVHRHFARSEEDRADAAAEAWERIWQQFAGLGIEEYKRHAGNAIVAFYRRAARQKKNGESFDPTGKASSAGLRALAHKAIDSDW